MVPKIDSTMSVRGVSLVVGMPRKESVKGVNGSSVSGSGAGVYMWSGRRVVVEGVITGALVVVVVVVVVDSVVLENVGVGASGRKILCFSQKSYTLLYSIKCRAFIFTM